MIRIAIDGACRRNGKPDCVSAGGIFVQVIGITGTVKEYTLSAVSEFNSTNQRGELLALLEALQLTRRMSTDAQIITDSEYVFNAMTKRWHNNWSNNGWLTASGEPVKNKDIWLQIHEVACEIDFIGLDVTYYHIKGHCIPFGAVTADRLLSEDDTGEKLYKAVCDKFDTVAPTKAEVFAKAQRLSEANNGYFLPDHVFKEFVVMNTVVDAIASTEVANVDTHSI